MFGNHSCFSEWNRLSKLVILAVASLTLPSAVEPSSSFRDRILVAHNFERDLHGVEPMQWDAGLARGAQAYARHLANTGKFEHSADAPHSAPVGENLWRGTAGAFEPERMLQLWIAEKEYFVAGRFPATSTTGNAADVSHFTQVVWRDSRRVGCAVATGGGKDVLVCRYSSAGNIIGRKVF